MPLTVSKRSFKTFASKVLVDGCVPIQILTLFCIFHNAVILLLFFFQDQTLLTEDC